MYNNKICELDSCAYAYLFNEPANNFSCENCIYSQNTSITTNQSEKITINDIFKAKELYCEDCCLSCDECGLKDFFDFELWDLVEKVRTNE